MKCPKCGGYGKLLKKEKGKSCYEVSLSFCDKCHGSGEIEVTNEEWLNTLPTEEKAKWLSRHSQFIYGCGQKGQIPKALYEEDWEYWLKQPNKE